MNQSVTALKLPVPGPWQAAVLLAMADLATRKGLPRSAVAPTRVESSSWTTAAGTVRGLEISLLAAGRPHRYRADLDSGTVEAMDGRG
jgi:hypothetical protein